MGRQTGIAKSPHRVADHKNIKYVKYFVTSLIEVQISFSVVWQKMASLECFVGTAKCKT